MMKLLPSVTLLNYKFPKKKKKNFYLIIKTKNVSVFPFNLVGLYLAEVDGEFLKLLLGHAKEHVGVHASGT